MSMRTTGLTISYTDNFSSDDESAAITPIPSRQIPAMPTPDSGAENALAQKRRGRPPVAGKAGAVKASSGRSRRASAGTKLGAKRAGVEKRTGTTKRPALKEITNAQEVDDVEEVDDFDVLSDANVPSMPQLASPVAQQPVSKRGRAEKKEKSEEKPRGRKGRPPVVAQLIMKEIPETQEEVIVQSKLARTQSNATKNPRPAKREIVSETQPEPMEIEETSPAEQEIDPIEDPTPKPSRTAAPNKRAVSATRQRRAPSVQRRAGSASDTERYGNDPTLRRKVGDLTKKLEALEVKYNTLRDIGVDDAETAFDKLKKQTDEKTKAANELIAALRADIKAQTALATESNSLRTQLATLTTSTTSLTSEKKSLQASLQEAQNESNALRAKLAAARASSASIQSTESRVPGSAVKGHHHHRTVLVGSAEAAKEAQKRVLKEELYSDLTGLILRDVKRKEERGEDVYDCIQTGRNGTLHFHLTLSNPTLSTSTNPTTTSSTPHHHAHNPAQPYEDAEFQYTPLLDPSRDNELMEILPDYLTEEICFPRSNAAKFYARVVDCLTKRVVDVEEEGEGEVGDGNE